MRAGRRQYKSRRRSSRPRNGRALSLAAILFLFALTLAPPIKHYFTQKAQINSLRSQLASDRAALDSARKELELWKDPNYVKSQARERLHFVLPGERQYIVLALKEKIQALIKQKLLTNFQKANLGIAASLHQ